MNNCCIIYISIILYLWQYFQHDCIIVECLCVNNFIFQLLYSSLLSWWYFSNHPFVMRNLFLIPKTYYLFFWGKEAPISSNIILISFILKLFFQLCIITLSVILSNFNTLFSSNSPHRKDSIKLTLESLLFHFLHTLSL